MGIILEMSTFRVVKFSNPLEFVEALRDKDDSFLNFPLGTFLDSFDPHHHDATKTSRLQWAIYKDNEVMLVSYSPYKLPTSVK